MSALFARDSITALYGHFNIILQRRYFSMFWLKYSGKSPAWIAQSDKKISKKRNLVLRGEGAIYKDFTKKAGGRSPRPPAS
ncbi:hypothetical protein HMPREF0262_01002 [Clostridium sp. ATCC 29733]|nr:hypothetical protein HMPREF0262_01002 [Clostridium sp. ATCC 29733]